MTETAEVELLEINSYPTPGKPLPVHQLEDPEDYDPEVFDPHGVSGDSNVCLACTRDIKVTAHLGSGFCAQVCRAVYAEARAEFDGTNVTTVCDWCSETVFDRDSVRVPHNDDEGWEGVCSECYAQSVQRR